MNRSVAKRRPRKPAAKKQAVVTPAWFRDPVVGDVIEVVILPSVVGDVVTWQATRVRGTNATSERIYTDDFPGSLLFDDFGARWRWLKTGRTPKAGDEIEFYLDSSKSWKCDRVLVGVAMENEGWLWRWPTKKPVPAAQPPAELRIPKRGDTIYLFSRSRTGTAYAMTVDLVERFPDRGSARFKLRDVPEWFYQDERGTFWDWKPPDTGTVQKAAVTHPDRIPGLDNTLQAAWAHLSRVQVDVKISEIRRVLNIPEQAHGCRTQDERGNDVLRFHWEEKKG